METGRYAFTYMLQGDQRPGDCAITGCQTQPTYWIKDYDYVYNVCAGHWKHANKMWMWDEKDDYLKMY